MLPQKLSSRMTGTFLDDEDNGSILGSSGADTIYGGQSTSETDGGLAINDSIDGGQSDDTIYAGEGDDLVFGGDAGDAAGGGTATAKSVETFRFDTDQATNVVAGSGPGNTGDTITYNDIATADDGTTISVRITIVSISNPDLEVELGHSDNYPLYLRGGEPGTKVDVRIDFLGPDGNPVAIDSNFTFRDIDNTGSNGREGVTFDTTDITSYAVSSDPATDVSADDRGDVIEFTTSRSGSIPDENLWTQVFFDGQSSLNFTVESREHTAGYGFDTADFGEPPDVFDVDASGDDLIYAGAGDDTALGGGGTDTIYGETGNDTLEGQKGDDTLFGGSGNDTLAGGAGTNTLDGGEGVDTADYSSAGSGVDVDLRDGTAAGLGSSDVLTSVEAVTGSDFDDTLDGSQGENTLYGGEGSDSIDGHGGADTLYGGDGGDQIEGGVGNDALFGGGGADELKGGEGDDRLAGGTGTDVLYGGADNDTWVLDEDGIGDSFFGGSGTNVLDATDVGSGVTLKFASDGEGAVLAGGSVGSFVDISQAALGSGSDVVDASGDSTGVSVDTGAGNDTLAGGAGDDTLSGGSGDDVFVLSDAGGNDTITDFELGHDLLETADLQDTTGGQVTAEEVVVTGGSGSPQVLHFPNGERVVVPDGSVNTSSREAQFASLVMMGVPPCFAPGTRIRTTVGDVAVEDLQVDDLVITADNGPQAIRWIGRRYQVFSGSQDQHLPILISAGSLGGGLPRRNLVVSPQHRILLSGPEVRTLVCEDEVLAPAKGLITRPGIRVKRGTSHIDYYALLFDRHEVIFAEGAKTESFRPGPVIMQDFSEDAREEIYTIYPQLKTDPVEGLGPPARRLITKRQTREAAPPRQLVM